ncbi:cellulose binding domain-containing protein [Thermobifida cellulosilytica]|uniref:Cellulose-binding protein n=1 Tax=Thermobifida cellulosilytica TB100 TaxID=665004 RepID=A0A147KDL4_THECS|nr:cellulose binding domain-containing protein [Thermobifida cellulosilytica]KUP95391.1 cellulose-binding protein [Thermobifida cellulosilytica TB100]
MSRTSARAVAGACGALALTAASIVTGGVSAASAADGCSVAYTVASDWGSGFVADVTVTNDSGSPATQWTVTWTLPPGHTVTNAWNADLSVTGSAVTAVNAGWNGALPAGASTSFGLQGTVSGASSVPSDLSCSFGTPGDPGGGDPGGEHPDDPGGGDPGGPVRIMPLGDSITGSPGCWRALLWRDLTAAGYPDVDFVGSRSGDGCGFPYDHEHEGHGGMLVTNLAGSGQLSAWLSAADPDIVLMHFGTNDVWSSRPTQAVLDAYSTLVAQMRAHNPSVTVLVAQIIPMDSARSCATCAQGVQDLNAAIPGWAADVSTPRSPVIVVDQWTGFSTATDTYDGVHPNASGDAKIAQRWLEALVPLLD